MSNYEIKFCYGLAKMATFSNHVSYNEGYAYMELFRALPNLIGTRPELLFLIRQLIHNKFKEEIMRDSTGIIY